MAFLFCYCILFVTVFGFFFHIQEGTILFMWVEGEGVQRVNSTCILKRNNKEGWQKVVQQMWVSEILQSSFAFVCLFLLLSNNLLASRSQAFRLYLEFTICHVMLRIYLIKFDIVVASSAPPLCNEFEK